MFIDERFPPKISFGAIGGPGFNTAVAVNNGGFRTANQVWAYELSEYEVAHAARHEPDWRALMAFFRVVYGMANTWRFKDWTDFVCVPGDGLLIQATGIGSPLGKQMVKRYVFGGQTIYRKISKPINGTITLVGGGTIDYALGVVNGGAPTAWSGEFDVHCAFGTDRMRHETINRAPDGSLIVGWQSIPVIEVRD